MGEQQSTLQCDEECMPSKLDEHIIKEIRPRITYLGKAVWDVQDKIKLQRFLILGSESLFSYKTSTPEPCREHALCIDRLISQEKGIEVVETIKSISLAGRAAKQKPTLFALAVCARSNDVKTKQAAYAILNDVCRIPTHLFLFIKYCEQESQGSTGWGRAHRTAMVNWYRKKCEKPESAGRLLTKYRKREEWTHRDVFRLAHIKPVDNATKIIVRFIIKGFDESKKLYENEMAKDTEIKKLIEFLEATKKAKTCTSETDMVKMIQMHGLVREHLPTQLLKSKLVWEALLKNPYFKIEAKIRNLGKITSLGLCDDDTTKGEIVKALADEMQLKNSRVHPFKILLALYTYKKGSGTKGGSLTWTANQEISKALEQAFYMSFKTVEPTKKRYLLAVDISGSMEMPCIGSHIISCRDAAAAMMMVTMQTEETCDVVAFSDKLTPMQINKDDKLDDVIMTTKRLPFGGTDCALPMIWAIEQKKFYDVFIIYTDSETWFGKIHPSRALVDYRSKMKIPDAKLVVVGMASNDFSIADPDDLGMLDVVGFDSDAAEIISKFSMGKV